MKHYFRRSIADKLLLAPSEELIDGGIFFPLSHIHNGVMDVATLSKIPDDYSRVLISPVLCALQPDHGFLPATWPKWISPLWFAATLDRRTGVISFALDRTPWIPRENLLPIDQGSLVWGTLSAWEKYIASHPFPALSSPTSLSQCSWEAGMSWMRDCVENVIGQSLDDFISDGYQKHQHAVMINADKHESSILSLLRIIDVSLLNPVSGKHSVMASVYSREAPSINELRKHSVWDGIKRHIAQVPCFPPLNANHSEALRTLLSGQHKISIIDAPDGTGKSHLLLHWLANQWAHSAISAETHSNILVVGDDDTLAHLSSIVTTQSNSLGRWCFPDLGWFSPFPEDHHINADTIQHGLINYLENAREFFNNETLDLDDAINSVYQKLTNLSDALQEIPSLMLFREDLDEKKKQLVHNSHGLSSHFHEFCFEAKKILDQRKEAWRVFSHLNEEWKKHVDSTPFWMEWTGGFPLTKQKNLERNKRFFSRFKVVPKNIIWDDNHQISQVLAKILSDVRRLVHDAQKTVVKVQAIEDGESKWRDRMKGLAGNPHHAYIGADGHLAQEWEKSKAVTRCEILIWAVRYHEGVWLKNHRDGNRAAISALFPATFVSVDSMNVLSDDHEIIWVHDYHRLPSVFTTVLSGITPSMVVAGDMLIPPPALDLSEQIDINNALHCHLIQHESDFKNFRRSNLSIVYGDFIKRAKSVTASHVSLKTDYVHSADIVSLLNQVAYHGGLELPDLSERKLCERFAFGWRHITDNGDPYRLPQTIAAWFELHAKNFSVDPSRVVFLTTSLVMSKKIRAALFETDFSSSDVRSVFDEAQRSKTDLVVFVMENNLMDNGFAIYEKKPDLWARILGSATQSVWFMGDMNGWSNRCNTTIGVVSHALFRSADHMLPDVPLPAWTHRRDLSSESFVINDWLQFWQQWSADQDASMVLASPLITAEGVSSAGFFEFAKTMSNNGVSISLYANKNLCEQYAGEYIPEFMEGCREHHVSVFWKNAVMDSMIWMDDSLVEMSGPFLGSTGPVHALYIQGDTHEWRRQHIASWDSPQF